jgi:hypothetical protein
MTRDNIIRMAHEAGFGFITYKPKSATHMQCGINNLESFVELVLADLEPKLSQFWMDGYESGTKTERKACAALLDKNAMTYDTPIYRSLLQANAEEIRARGKHD